MVANEIPAKQLQLFFSRYIRFRLLNVAAPGDSAVMVSGPVICRDDKIEASTFAEEACAAPASFCNLIRVAVRLFVIRHLLLDALCSVAISWILKHIEAENHVVESVHLVAGIGSFALLALFGLREVQLTLKDEAA